MVETQRHGQWMIYKLPLRRGGELDLQLRCLQDCVQSDPVFRRDLKELKKLQCECEWVTEAVGGSATKERK